MIFKMFLKLEITGTLNLPYAERHRKDRSVAVCLGLGTRAVEEDVSYASHRSVSFKTTA